MRMMKMISWYQIFQNSPSSLWPVTVVQFVGKKLQKKTEFVEIVDKTFVCTIWINIITTTTIIININITSSLTCTARWRGQGQYKRGQGSKNQPRWKVEIQNFKWTAFVAGGTRSNYVSGALLSLFDLLWAACSCIGTAVAIQNNSSGCVLGRRRWVKK